jgi:hypothetical protein
LIGLTLLLIVDVHYRMNNGEFANVAVGEPPGSGQVGSGQAGGSGVTTPGEDTTEHRYANRLSAAKLTLRQQRENNAIFEKHDKVRYAQPSNISQLVNL